MQDAFGSFYFGGLRIWVKVRKAFSLFCDGFFNKVRVVFFHIFKLNLKRFFVFVQGRLGFSYSFSFKNNKCLMKPIKKLIELIIVG
jgi:hypothetical protein